MKWLWVVLVLTCVCVQEMKGIKLRQEEEKEEEGKEKVPDEATLKRAQLFTGKVAERLAGLQKRATPKKDERPVGVFEPPAGQDPFVSYLGFINDSSLKSYLVIEKKNLAIVK